MYKGFYNKAKKRKLENIIEKIAENKKYFPSKDFKIDCAEDQRQNAIE